VTACAQPTHKKILRTACAQNAHKKGFGKLLTLPYDSIVEERKGQIEKGQWLYKGVPKYYTKKRRKREEGRKRERLKVLSFILLLSRSLSLSLSLCLSNHLSCFYSNLHLHLSLQCALVDSIVVVAVLGRGIE
jgi:hypothetical protein